MKAFCPPRPRTAVLALSLSLALPALAEMRSVDGLEFRRVVLVGAGEVEISQGDGYALQLRGDSSDLDRAPFYTSGDDLVLGKTRFSPKSYNRLQFRVVMPALDEVRVAGSGSAYVRDFTLGDATEFIVDGSGDIRLFGVEAGAVKLRVKGSGDIRAVRVAADTVEANVSGSGDLYIGSVTAEIGEFVVTGSGDLEVTDGGFVRDLEVNVIGSGDARLDDVSSEGAEVNIVGSGTAVVGQCASTLEASVLGSGDVRYGGTPEIESTSFGSGEIRRQDR